MNDNASNPSSSTAEDKGMLANNDWFTWALLSAFFAALTAILAKIGLKGIDPDFATLIRTVVIVVCLAAMVYWVGKWKNPLDLPAKSLLFLGLSGLATGASWVCYFRALQLGEASKVAPVDKLSLVLVVIAAVLFLGDRPSLTQWTAIALIVSGCILFGWNR